MENFSLFYQKTGILLQKLEKMEKKINITFFLIKNIKKFFFVKYLTKKNLNNY